MPLQRGRPQRQACCRSHLCRAVLAGIARYAIDKNGMAATVRGVDMHDRERMTDIVRNQEACIMPAASAFDETSVWLTQSPD